MSFKYSLTMKIAEFGKEISVSGELNDTEFELVKDFVSYADELFHTPFIHKRDYGKFSMKGDKPNNFSIETELPDWNDVTVFLHKLRPFILNNERTYFHKVRKLLGLKFADEYFRGFFNLQKERFNNKRQQGSFQLTSDNEILNSEKMLYEWLNAHEYHREKEKQKFLENLHQIFPLDASKVIFLGFLLEKAQAVFNVADFIDVMLGKHKNVTLNSELKQNQ